MADPLYDSHDSKNRRVKKGKSEKGKYGYTRPPLSTITVNRERESDLRDYRGKKLEEEGICKNQ